MGNVEKLLLDMGQNLGKIREFKAKTGAILVYSGELWDG